jgi:hypothetical protein
MTTRKWEPATKAELRRELEAAREAGRRELDTEPRAASASYNADTGRVEVELRNGCAFAFPPELGQGLAGASPAQLAQVEVTPDGYGLHWEALDADLAVPALLQGVFGSRAWMSQWGRIGGSARSEAKAAAARANGARGGRPRKQPDAAAGDRESETKRKKVS